MSRLGLVNDCNKSIKQELDPTPLKKKKTKVPDAIVEMLDVPVVLPLIRGKYFMTEEEQMYIGNLIVKYKDDYTGMFRDIKLNYKQHPKSYLERR